MTMSRMENPADSISQLSAATMSAVQTSRCEISSLSSTTFAQTMSCINTSPRDGGGIRDSFQNLPSSSGNAATAWLPVVMVKTRPRARLRSFAFATTSTLGRSSRCVAIPRSITNVSFPTSYASNVRSRPIATVLTNPRRRSPETFTLFRNWRKTFISRRRAPSPSLLSPRPAHRPRRGRPRPPPQEDAAAPA